MEDAMKSKTTMASWVVAAVLACGVVQADDSGPVAAGRVVHDCRLRRLHLKATRRRGDLVLRVTHLGFDGRILAPRLCPDNREPTWTIPEGSEYAFEGETGHVLTIKNAVRGDLYPVSVATTQWPDKEFIVEKVFRF
jgi:hypothetical protein